MCCDRKDIYMCASLRRQMCDYSIKTCFSIITLSGRVISLHLDLCRTNMSNPFERFCTDPQITVLEPTAPVADPLAECALTRNHATVYPITRAIELIEGISPKEASNRWTGLKPKLPDVTTSRVGRNVCCDEDSMLSLLKAMKECPKKTAALTTRGISEDTAKVREIVLHAEGGHQIAIEVCFVYYLMARGRTNPPECFSEPLD